MMLAMSPLRRARSFFLYSEAAISLTLSHSIGRERGETYAWRSLCCSKALKVRWSPATFARSCCVSLSSTRLFFSSEPSASICLCWRSVRFLMRRFGVPGCSLALRGVVIIGSFLLRSASRAILGRSWRLQRRVNSLACHVVRRMAELLRGVEN